MGRIKAALKIILAVGLVIGGALYFSQTVKAPGKMEGSFSITYLDVGQADAALVECDGHYMLIDGGNADDSDLLYSVLESRGIQELDLLVASHEHEDHVGGLSGALHYASADRILCSVTAYHTKEFEKFKEQAKRNGTGITVPQIGDQYTLGSAVIDILGVGARQEAEYDTDDNPADYTAYNAEDHTANNVTYDAGGNNR